jgi:hypothetical protein
MTLAGKRLSQSWPCSFKLRSQLFDGLRHGGD